MRPLPQLFYSTVLATFTMLAYSADAGAYSRDFDEKLECPKSEADPYSKTYEGRDDVTYSVKAKGMEVDGRKEMVTRLRGSYSFKERRALPSDLKEIVTNSEVLIVAQCGKGSKLETLWSNAGKGSSGDVIVLCKKGEPLIVQRLEPTCDIGSNEHIWVTITETTDDNDLVAQDEQRKREEERARDLAELKESQERAYRALAQIEREQGHNRVENARFERLNQHVLNGGRNQANQQVSGSHRLRNALGGLVKVGSK